jgi:tRNA (cmo5U34)-methyltransferase
MSKESGQDTIFSEQLDSIPKFTFDQKVVDVFPDMIKRSVPGYATILHMIGQMAEKYAQADTYCYDIGCSLGAGILAMRHRINAEGASIVGIDNSKEMIERCRDVIAADSFEIPVNLVATDVMQYEFKPMSVCVMNFTLQFIAPEKRALLLERVAKAMVPGGVLILSEKLSFPDQEHENLMIELHHNFKRSNGYSDLEVAQKRDAIENVLIPETFQTHKTRLVDAGFRSADLWFQCFNFSSLIAFR